MDEGTRRLLSELHVVREARLVSLLEEVLKRRLFISVIRSQTVSRL